MKKIKLNYSKGKIDASKGYILDPKEEYVITLEDEFEEQSAILASVQMFPLTAIFDWHNWLAKNGISLDYINPSNSLVGKYYGKEPLWITELSQGLVMKNENDDDFYIVMECSRENEGFKRIQIVLTMGGCM